MDFLEQYYRRWRFSRGRKANHDGWGLGMERELSTATAYREQTAQLLRMSAEEIDEIQKTLWLDMATLYCQAADRLERMHRGASVK